MTLSSPEMDNRRILVVDDEPLIHFTFRTILAEAPPKSCPKAGESGGDDSVGSVGYQVDIALDGGEGLDRVRQALECGRPYAVAFVDKSMPGLDGLETIAGIWKLCPETQIILCTGKNDYSWSTVADRLGSTDRLLILKKPFDKAEVLQLACALTEKWRLERQAANNTERLQRMVEERTAEIQRTHEELVEVNRALAAARDAAEAASRAKSIFLANMSHEIRTPMTAILGFADVLLAHLSEPVAVDAARTIRRNGDYLLEIINDVLDLTKIEAGRMEVERVACQPCEVIAAVLSLMRVRIDSNRLSLNVNFDGPVPERIHTDPVRLRQVLINLIGNAIKFTPQGEVRLIVRTVDADSVAPKLQFDVIDTGIGMSEEQRAELFQPFVQADTSMTRRFGGTGLGLAISKRLAQALGGDLVAERNLGKGMRFAFTVATGSLDSVSWVTSPDASILQPPEDDRPKRRRVRLNQRILLAEDGPDNQRLIAYILAKAGADLVIAGDGQKAIDLVLESQADGRPFDAILMDMQMPVLDGYTATRKLRASGYRGVIIALTAHAMKGDREKCLAAGCDDYTTKPIDREALLQMLQNLVGRNVPDSFPS